MAGAEERNRHLLEQFSKDELDTLLAQVDHLTGIAAEMLAVEKDLS